MSRDPVYRKYHHNRLTFRMLYSFTENFVLALSHDEVVHGKASLLGKMPGDDWQKFANLRLLYSYMFSQPGKKLLFMGGEFGQSREWAHEQSLDWHLCRYPDHEGVRLLVRDLNKLYTSDPVLGENDFNPQGFRWLSCHDAHANLLAYLRTDRAETALYAVICHFGGSRREMHVGVPRGGFWREVLNTNSAYYGGSGLGNDGGRTAEKVARDEFGQSLRVVLPPLSVFVFKWQGEQSPSA
jgi:1,4-alpha-glucan branching enzyme